MKKFVLLVLLSFFLAKANATHIAGGELTYERVRAGASANSDVYKVTMRLFRQCDNTGGTGAALTIEVPQIGIYNTSTLSRVATLQLSRIAINNIINNPNANPCLVGSTTELTACYDIGVWSAEIELPRTIDGYTLVWARYTRRMSFVQNVNINTATGATFTTQIPGTNSLPTGYNSSPKFVVRDTAIVCSSVSFSLDYSANDIDGDSLSYKFVPAYEGIGGSDVVAQPFDPPNGSPPATVSFTSLSYISPYSSNSPLGSPVTINSNTGIMSGIAPATPGYYVICVAVEEWRNGVKINEHRKDFILKVGDCNLAGASLTPNRWSCDGFTWNFQNESTSASIINYLWNFGDGTTSTLPTPAHTYIDTGVYKVKLYVTATGGCKDSAFQTLNVFPGFKANIQSLGSCVQAPIRFYDSTQTAYGFVNSWKWDFGDLTTQADTARSRDTAWKYSTANVYNVTLISTNSKGCIDTVSKQITVRDAPILILPFKDTLICSIDTLQLTANSTGVFTWTPNYNILNANTSTPLVYPKDTTKYIITVNEDGCISKDSVTVNVLDFITVDAGKDSVICKTDTIKLYPTSHALSYLWTATTGVPVASVKYPSVAPLVKTKYYVTANLGKCQDKDSVTITPVAYPQAKVLDAAPICFGDKVQLNASIVGSSFFWSPTNSLSNPNILNPFAAPSKTTSYIITAYDTLGCPKPFKDTVTVTVIPLVVVNAGRDTSIVRNQPLQLNVTTSRDSLINRYLWQPKTGLNNDTIKNPIAVLNLSIDSIKYVVRVSSPEGCYGEDDIVVRIFNTNPDIFVPTAFTPNGDGKNDIIRPICVGITKLDFFRIYNRWGQLVYQTSEFEKGWDGNFNGVAQASGTFVFVTQGTDFTGKVVFKKGTCVLIR